MVARIRRNFCQYGRKDLKQLLSVYDAMGKTGRLPEDVDEIVLVDLYLLSSGAPMWDHCGRKDQKKFLSV